MKDLSDETRLLCLLSAHTAAGNLMAVARDWSFLNEEQQIKGIEILLQTSIFGGFHRVLNAFETIYSVGISPNLKFDNTEDTNFTQNGENLLKLIYGRQYPALRDKLKNYHSDVERAIVDCAYGRVLSRPHITPAERELCSLACLAGETVIPQLHSHLLGALNAGATLNQIRGILDQTATVWGSASQTIVDGYWLDFVSHVSKKS